MVRTGTMRAFGAALRRTVGATTGSRLGAFLTGLGVTGVTQSSTATALLAVSFVERDLIRAVPALALLLGADVGTTLVAQLLSFDLGFLSPLLLVAGVTLFSRAGGGRWRHVGRILVGLGLMLLSLQLVGSASAPLRESETLGLVLAPLADEPLLALLTGAAIAWAVHSSLAFILLLMSLAASGAVPLPLAFVLVLGANVGGAIVPVVLSLRAGAAARRAPLGNLLMRLAGALALLPLLPEAQPWIAALDSDATRQIANLHTLFNLAVALAFLPLLDLVAALCARLLPALPQPEDRSRPRYLDEDAIAMPAEALAAAARETLRMGDVVESMLRRTIEVFRADDLDLAAKIEAEDDVVDGLHEAIKFYLMRMSQNELDEAESRRLAEILTFTTNLEHIGDIIDRNLMELARKKAKSGVTFSPEGFAEICAFHDRIVDNLRLALNVFMSGDVRLARQLLAEKVAVREAELTAAENHLERLRAGLPESIASSSLHLDVLRDLKRISSHITAVAYPILETTGELRASRLARPDRETVPETGRGTGPDLPAGPGRPAEAGGG